MWRRSVAPLRFQIVLNNYALKVNENIDRNFCFPIICKLSIIFFGKAQVAAIPFGIKCNRISVVKIDVIEDSTHHHFIFLLLAHLYHF